MPLLGALLAWAERNAPEGGDRQAVLWGDPGAQRHDDRNVVAAKERTHVIGGGERPVLAQRATRAERERREHDLQLRRRVVEGATAHLINKHAVVSVTTTRGERS